MTAEYRTSDGYSVQLAPDTRTCTFRAFADGKAAKAYLARKQKERKEYLRLFRDLAAMFPVPRATRARR